MSVALARGEGEVTPNTVLTLMRQPQFQFGSVWCQVKDGDDTARAIFDGHYSRRRYADGRKPLIFVGPGEKIVLITPDASALFIWRKFISGDDQQGVNCAVFRNEGPALSSALIIEAEKFARERWPNERLYTYVNPHMIRSTNPGYCFLKAGWRRCGVTKGRLIILEKVQSTYQTGFKPKNSGVDATLG
jgi:hypothetical protein